MMSKLLPMAMMPPTPLKPLLRPVARVVRVFSVDVVVPLVVPVPVPVVPVVVPVVPVFVVVPSWLALNWLSAVPRLLRSR